MQESKQGIVIIETIFCGVLYIETWGVLSYVLDSVNIWMPQERKQGTVIVETIFCYLCHLNLVSFIVHARFTCVTF